MNSRLPRWTITAAICALVFVLLPCWSIAGQETLSALSKPEIARIQTEFRKKFVLGENSKNRPRRAEVEALIAPHKEAIGRIPGFIGVAFGIRIQSKAKQPTMDYVFKIYIDPESKGNRTEVMKNLPKTIGPYEVVLVEGVPRPTWGGCDNSDFTLYNPLVPGINVGIPSGQGGAVGTCGTLGVIVWKKDQSYDSAVTERYFLSAWHVLTQNGIVPTPVEISQPGNSWNKPEIVGVTAGVCDPFCSKFRYEVGLVQIYTNRGVGSSYLLQKDPYDPGLPTLPPALYQGCGIGKHVLNGTASVGGCVVGFYRDFFLSVNVPLGTRSYSMVNQMVFEALYASDIITSPGDSGMVWADPDGSPNAITMAQATAQEPYANNQPFNISIASPLGQVFDEFGITAIMPAPPEIGPPISCIVARSLGNAHDQAVLELEVAPILHNSELLTSA